MGFSGMMEEENNPNDWFSNTEEHHTLAGGYQNVHIYFTAKGFQATHKWTNTDMSGVLRVIQVKEQDSYPVIMLQLKGQDSAGIERDTVFEFELPMNFVFELDLTRTFSAVGFTNGEYIGFLFDSYEDKEDFSGKMGAIHG